MRAQSRLKDNVLRSIHSDVRNTTRTTVVRKYSDSSFLHTKDSFFRLFAKPALQLQGGISTYQFNYRSFIDTPFAEKDLLQHQLIGSFNATVAGNFPLQFNFRLQRSNSHFFRDVTDVQVLFVSNQFRSSIQQSMRAQLLAALQTRGDSLQEKTYLLKSNALENLAKILETKFHSQYLVEANEVLTVPKITWNSGLPDSVNIKREDSLKHIADLFISEYNEAKRRYEKAKTLVDSLKNKVEQQRDKVKKYKELVSGNWDQIQSARQWKAKLREYDLQETDLPEKYRWLLGIRNFSLGRSPLNYSELSAKNISINGLNFEYNSWYYFALTAGMIDFRFRDFAVNGDRRQPQYLAMVRAGIGRLEKSHVILSAFRGRKQQFRSSIGSGSMLNITGFTASSRWAVNRNTYITAEIGKSMTPDFRSNPVTKGPSLSLSDNGNQAYALHLNSYIPFTRSRVEAFYKKAGANYQSFSSYSVNTAVESWYVKAEQSFLKKQLRIAASLRKNEFSNPFVLQDYKNQTLMKSLTGTMRIRRWPLVTVGLQPISQLTKVADQVIENRFQSLNTTVYHGYKHKQLRMATLLTLNKFYNDLSDTAFTYYNATSTYISQQFLFSSFSAAIASSITSNGSYRYQVLDGNVQPNIPRLGSITLGVKINNMNNDMIKAGGYLILNVMVFKSDRLMVSYDHGYLPASGGRLVRNEMGTVQFTKAFNFK